eukprot:scaffold11.g3853.t1
MLAISSLCASSSLLQARPRPAIAATRQRDGDDELRRPRPPASAPTPGADPTPHASPPVERGRQWRKQQQQQHVRGADGGHSSSRGPSRGRSSSESRAGRWQPAVVDFTRQINILAKTYVREKDSTERDGTRQHYLQLRAQGLESLAGELDAYACAQVLWTSAKFGQPLSGGEEQAWRAAVERTLQSAEPQGVSNMLFSWATLGMPAGDSLLRLLDRLLEVLEDADPQAMANTLWAFGTLGHRPPDQALSELLDGLLADKLWRAEPQHISNSLWACGELDFMPESSLLAALLARFAAWLEAGDAARPVPTPQQFCNVLWGCAELQQHAASAQPKQRPSWRCNPGFLDLCTAWAQQRFEQFTALEACDFLYSLVRLERDPPAVLVSAALENFLTSSSSAQDTWVTNLGLALQAADPATATSLAWLAGWVFEQAAALPECCAQEGFGVDAAAGSATALQRRSQPRQAIAAARQLDGNDELLRPRPPASAPTPGADPTPRASPPVERGQQWRKQHQQQHVRFANGGRSSSRGHSRGRGSSKSRAGTRPADPVVDFTRQINNLAKAYVRARDSTERDGARQRYLQLRAQGLESLAGELDAYACAQLLWTSTQFGQPLSGGEDLTWRAAVERTLQSAAPQGVSNILWAWAKLGMPAGDSLLPRLMDRLLEEEVLGSADPQAIANTLWARATLGMPAGDSLLRLLDRLLEVLRDATPQAIANTLWACATLGHRPPDRALAALTRALSSEDKLWRAVPQAISISLWACGELDFKPEHDVMAALLERFAAWLEAGDAARPVPTPQQFCNMLWGCAELQQHAASAQPKQRPSWRCNPGFLDLCTAWAQQRFEQFTALEACDFLYSLVHLERDPPAYPPPALVSAALEKLQTDSNVEDKSMINLVWAATRCLERTQLEVYHLPPAELGRVMQLCVAQWRTEQAVPIPGALRLLDSLLGQGLALQAAEPATAASLAWLAGWVFEQVAALSEGRAQEGFGIDATASLLNSLAALDWQPSGQQAAAVVALCQWLARRSPGTPELNAGNIDCLLRAAESWRLDVATKALRSLPDT